MNQQWLIEHVLDHLDTTPASPRDDGREYLSYARAERIVDDAVEELGAHGEETEYTYIRGHRVRLAHSLTMIPIAQRDDETLLDVGCYGYMALWASRHLGYARVVGIEWHPDVDEAVIERELTLGGDCLTLRSHNFDITDPGWTLKEQFDCVLFFEVLEHINTDPMGVMERINAHLKESGTLVMSVPNAISYKAFKEFLVGMPPWTYWFYEPDLSHEPRHCFEYTPIVFKSLLAASGMRENAFRTIYAYSRPEREGQTLEIAESIGFDGESFGETMIANATKTRAQIPLRYPDVLYSPEGYYRHVHPRLQERFAQRVEAFHEGRKAISEASAAQAVQRVSEQIEAKRIEAERVASEDEVAREELREQISQLLFACETHTRRQGELASAAEDAAELASTAVREKERLGERAHALEQEKRELETKVNQLLFMCDCSMQKESELTASADAAIAQRDEAVGQSRAARAWADTLSQENADLRAQVNELLFACDCYLQQVNDPARCAQVIRQRRFRRVLDRSKSVARRTPLLGTALRPVYRGTKKFIKRRL